LAEESGYLEKILDSALSSLLQLRAGSKKNYGSRPAIGHVFLDRFNANNPGIALVEYCPSPYYTDKWGYVQKVLASIDLKGRKYTLNFNPEEGEDYCQIPKTLMGDLPGVLPQLGLKQSKQADSKE
jgi:hypothetical protein